MRQAPASEGVEGKTKRLWGLNIMLQTLSTAPCKKGYIHAEEAAFEHPNAAAAAGLHQLSTA